MKMINKKRLFRFSLFTLCLAFVSLMSSNCYADGEGPSSGRIIYNNIMLFVNFGILVFLYIRYANKPLMAFLKNEGHKVKNKIEEMEIQLEEAKKAMATEESKINNIEDFVDKIRKNILELARREKEKIIEGAKFSADRMISDANRYAVYQLAKAQKELSDDIVEKAISIVEERLIKGFSEKDDKLLFENFMDDLQEKSTLSKP